MRAGRKSWDKAHLHQLQCYLGFLQDAINLKRLYRDFHVRRGTLLKDPINTGSILYVSRQRPRHTHEFVFDFDQAMWDEATAILAKWKQNFIDGELPERFPWRWTEPPCNYCEVKKLCKLDYKAGVDRLEDSHANAFAKKLRPTHDYKKIHKAVLKRWEKK